MNSVRTKRIRVSGIVQGVGFRPTVVRHARTAGITGTVCNKGPYVEIYAQGTQRSLGVFLALLKDEAPARADIVSVQVVDVSMQKTVGAFSDFRIIPSDKTTGDIFIPPDIAICEDCKKELFDPDNRRYLHPFINCTQCGPRMTIIDNLPYDRERTSMKHFKMCPACRQEYTDPHSRRYDAQPVCCNDCGPQVYLLTKKGFDDRKQGEEDPALVFPDRAQTSDFRLAGSAVGHAAVSHAAVSHAAVSHAAVGHAAVSHAAVGHAAVSHAVVSHEAVSHAAVGHAAISYVRRVIAEGGIAAIKGIGGFHLCCDATNPQAVLRLRQKKNRPKKPFAVMMKDVQTVERECLLTPAQKKVLTGHRKPILLLEKRREGERPENTGSRRICSAVAPDNPTLGVMLPYAPIQLLLFSYDDDIRMPDCLVMTSGNVAGAPIARTDEDAISMLDGFCDCILSNNRPILIRSDDSVMDFYENAPYMIRRSRGYAPLPVVVDCDGPGDAGRGSEDSCILAIGGELKNTFCIRRGNLFYPSSYVGDLSDARSVTALEDGIRRMLRLLEAVPERIVCDLHPRYLSVQTARKLGEEFHVPVVQVQHHYAHILSCMAENNYTGRCLGIAMDGTGYGIDKTIWGGEILIADTAACTRAASIMPFWQIGGDAAAREGRRIAASMIYGLCKRTTDDARSRVMEMIRSLGLCREADAQILCTMYDHKLNAVTSTSAGRLFDAAAAILGICRSSSFEGEASAALMYHAMDYACTYAQDCGQDSSQDCGQPDREGLPGEADQLVSQITQNGTGTNEEDTNAAGKSDAGENIIHMPSDELIRVLIRERLRFLAAAGTQRASGIMREDQNADMLAYVFHKALAEMLVAAAVSLRHDGAPDVCALSGGCFQNKLLLQLTEQGLKKQGFTVLRHHMIPPNDGGIALGQALADV